MGVEEGEHDERPLAARGFRLVVAKSIELDAPAHEVLAVENGTWRDGVYALATANLTLRWRIDEPMPVRLRFDADLSRANSFNLTWRGATPTAVLGDSHLDARTEDRLTHRFSATFTIALEDGTLIEGRFPGRTH